MPLTKDQIFAIQRPDPKLLTLYLIQSLPALFLMPVVFLPLFFKYKTLKYRFDEKGISMSWGILFRRETYLTYGKIQDIHLTRHLFERWLGLGTLQVQTASGSASAEMSLVGIMALEDLRDFIYSQMKGHDSDASASATIQEADPRLTVLAEIRDQLTTINAKLEER